MDDSHVPSDRPRTPMQAVADELRQSERTSVSGEFLVRIKTLDEGTLSVILRVSDELLTSEPGSNIAALFTVLQLKEELAKVIDLERTLMRLIFRGKIMQDADTLHSCNVEDGMTVHLVARSNDPGIASPNYGAFASPQVSPARPRSHSRGNAVAQRSRFLLDTLGDEQRGEDSSLGPSSVRPLGMSAVDAAALEGRAVGSGTRGGPIGPGAHVIARAGVSVHSDGQAEEPRPSPHILAAHAGLRALGSLTDWGNSARVSLGVGVGVGVSNQTTPHSVLPALENVVQGLHTVRTVVTAMGWGGHGPAVEVGDRLPVARALLAGMHSAGERGRSSPVPCTTALPSLTGWLDPCTGEVEVVGEGEGARPPFHSSAALHAASAVSGAALALTDSTPGDTSSTGHSGVAGRTRRYFAVGQWVDVLDTVDQWLEAAVVRVRGEYVHVHYSGWPGRWDEWLHLTSPRLAPFRSRSQHATLPFGACPWPVNILLDAPRVGLPPRLLSPPSTPHTHEPGPDADWDSLASAGRVSFSTPSLHVEVCTREDDPRPALLHAVDATSLLLGMLSRVAGLGGEQVRREARRAALLGGAPSTEVYSEAGRGGMGQDEQQEEGEEQDEGEEECSEGEGDSRPPVPVSSPLTPSRAAGYGGYLSYQEALESKQRTDTPEPASGRAKSLRVPASSPTPLPVSRLSQSERVEAAEAAARSARVRDYQQGLEDRTEMSVLAQQLAPLMDRVGRILTDLAPHIEVLGRAPTFSPRISTSSAISHAQGQGRQGEGSPAPAPAPASAADAVSALSDGGRALQAMLERLRSQVSRVREDTHRLSHDVARLRSNVMAQGEGEGEGSRMGADAMGGRVEDSTVLILPPTPTPTPTPTPPPTTTVQGGATPQGQGGRDTQTRAGTGTGVARTRGLAVYAGARFPLPGLMGAVLGAPPSPAPPRLPLTVGPHAYARYVSTPALRDGTAAGYATLVRPPLTVPMDVDILSVRQPGFALRAGDGSLSLLHPSGRPPQPQLLPGQRASTRVLLQAAAASAGGTTSPSSLSITALVSLASGLEEALGTQLSAEDLSRLYGQLLLEDYLDGQGGRPASATERTWLRASASGEASELASSSDVGTSIEGVHQTRAGGVVIGERDMWYSDEEDEEDPEP